MINVGMLLIIVTNYDFTLTYIFLSFIHLRTPFSIMDLTSVRTALYQNQPVMKFTEEQCYITKKER